MLAALGYRAWACDDFGNRWYHVDGNLRKIEEYAARHSIALGTTKEAEIPFSTQFDAVLLQDVIEHLHHSPRPILERLVASLVPGGYLVITVPNAVNARKRLDVVRGRTNLPPYAHWYWAPGPWRGHVREFTHRDLELTTEYLRLEIVELFSAHHMLHRVRPSIRAIHRVASALVPSLRDTWVLVARKPADWKALPELDDAALMERAGMRSAFVH